MPAPRKNEERLQAAMLLANGLTVAGTAEAVGVSETSVFAWLREPEFADRVRLMTEAVQAAAMTQLRASAQKATDVLVQALTRPPEWRDRIRAADLILSRIGIEAGTTVTTRESGRATLAERIAAKLGIDKQADGNRDEEPA